MKRETGRNILLGFLIFTLILFSLSFVAAQQDGVIKSIWDTLFGGISGPNFGNWQVIIGRICLIVLVFLVVYSVSDFMPVVSEENWVRWIFSGIVAVLSFLFITDELIRVVLAQYEAMSVAIIGIIPLIVLFAITYKLRNSEKSRSYAAFINPFMWILFIIWMILIWSSHKQEGLRWVYLLILAIGVFFVFFGNWVYDIWNQRRLKEEMSLGLSKSKKDQLYRLRAKREDLQQTLVSAGTKSEREYILKRIKQIDDDITGLLKS